MEIADYIVAEDRRLVELVLEGDDRAFEYLFNRYRDAYRIFKEGVSFSRLRLSGGTSVRGHGVSAS